MNGEEKILNFLADMKQDLMSELKDIRTTVDEHTEQLKALQKTVDEHTKILDEHTKILNEHTKILDEHSTKLDLLESRVDLLQTRVEENTAFVRALREGNEMLKAQMDRIDVSTYNRAYIDRLTSTVANDLAAMAEHMRTA